MADRRIKSESEIKAVENAVSGQRNTADAPLGWHVISGEDLLEALRRCAAGENADLVYAELWANAEHEKIEGEETAEAREEKAIQVIEDLLGNVPPFHSWPQEKEAWEKAQDDAQAFVDAQKKKKSPFREPKMEKIDKGIDWIGRVQEDEE
jgi:hypothetical protein